MESRAWIFLSHASADLAVVRLVRNYLESKGAAPLIFYLRALTQYEEFWPLIEREIQARRFFLYCESQAAAESEWVARERAAVAALPDNWARRIERIGVGTANFDTDALDEFVRLTKVFPNLAAHDRQAAAPFLEELRRVGFQVFDELKLPAGCNWAEAIGTALREAAEEGWVVSFVSAHSAASACFEHEMIEAAALGARFVPVLLEPVSLPPVVCRIQAFDAFSTHRTRRRGWRDSFFSVTSLDLHARKPSLPVARWIVRARAAFARSERARGNEGCRPISAGRRPAS